MDGEDMTDELDELLWQMWLDEHGEEDFDEHKTKIKQAIQALIAKECNKARLNELERYFEYWRNSKDTRGMDTYKADRIAELSNKENK